jgi:hypothetical protein
LPFLEGGLTPVSHSILLPPWHSVGCTGDLPRLVVGSDNSLQAFDSETMMRQWYIAFDTPPVAAFRQDGYGGNCLDPDKAAGGRAPPGGSR